MGAFQFSVHFDANKLKIRNITDWIQGVGEVTTGTLLPGILTFVWAADTKGISIADGILCNLHFLSNSTEESMLSFTENPTAIEFTDYDGKSFIPDLNGGLVKSTSGSGPYDPSGFTVYPNPNDGKFHLHFDAEPTTVSIRILNILGVPVYEEKEVHVGPSGSLELNLANHPEGVYTLTIDDHRRVTYQKVVIRR